MSFPRYPKYKDSGVEWLGEVPEHWRIAPLKRVATIRYGIGEPPNYQDEGTPLIRATNVHAGSLFPDGMVFVDPNEIPEQRIVWLAAGDIIVVRSGAYTGDSAIIPDGFGPSIAGFDMVLKCHSAHPHFIQFALLSNYLKEGQIDLEKMRAAQPHLNAEELGSCVLILPGADEQTLISEFLDRETAKINGLVGEQRRLIELLKEKRQAVISHAVTKGLNPHAPMKPSGIEWLGDVPEHWEVGPVKRFFTFLDCRRVPLSQEERSGRTGDIPYYGASGIIDWIDEFIFEEDLVLVSEDGANLINRATPIAFVATGKYWVNNHAHILKPPDNNFAFWAECIESTDLYPFVTGSAQPKFTAEALNNWMIAVPPSEAERAAIQKHFTALAEELDALTAEAQRAIDLLQERRTALISAAVTGKIDVRGLAESEAA